MLLQDVLVLKPTEWNISIIVSILSTFTIAKNIPLNIIVNISTVICSYIIFTKKYGTLVRLSHLIFWFVIGQDSTYTGNKVYLLVSEFTKIVFTIMQIFLGSIVPSINNDALISMTMNIASCLVLVIGFFSS